MGILGLLSNNRDDKEEGDNSIRLYRGKLDKLGKIQVLSVYSLVYRQLIRESEKEREYELDECTELTTEC